MAAHQESDCRVAISETGASALKGSDRQRGPLRRAIQRLTEAADHWFTGWRLGLLDRFLGPMPETPEDRAIQEEGERLRRAFPQINFDNPKPRIVRPGEPL